LREETGLPSGGPKGDGLTKKTKSEVCCASFSFFMPPNAQIRAFGILREKGQDYLAVVLRGWLNKERIMCWPASHAFHFSFCKIAQSKGRALAIFRK
jgi:hypothetical protein